MKKLLAITLALCIVLGLSACGGGQKEPEVAQEPAQIEDVQKPEEVIPTSLAECEVQTTDVSIGDKKIKVSYVKLDKEYLKETTPEAFTEL